MLRICMFILLYQALVLLKFELLMFSCELIASPTTVQESVEACARTCAHTKFPFGAKICLWFSNKWKYIHFCCSLIIWTVWLNLSKWLFIQSWNMDYMHVWIWASTNFQLLFPRRSGLYGLLIYLTTMLRVLLEGNS